MTRSPRLRHLCILLLSGLLAGSPALAEKPDGVGGGKGNKEAKGQKEHKAQKEAKGDKRAKAQGEPQGGKAHAKAARRDDIKVGAYFSDQHRDAARSYYGQRYGAGKGCPPGLAKKNNGCLPPGQAKKWMVGQPLPAGVVVYSVPRQVLVQLPPAPVGYRYVRVASDILLIAIGTQMVMDGISDLMRL
jgi:Ni/Co efflux regulator RcnB